MGERVWKLGEVRQVLPDVIIKTRTAYEKTRAILVQLEAKIHPEIEMERLEDELQGLMDLWVMEIHDLGAVVKGLWLVDFDNGSGYYCWRMGEEEILYEHSYESGFAGRKPIVENDEEIR